MSDDAVREAEKIVGEYLERLGYEHKKKRNPRFLSGPFVFYGLLLIGMLAVTLLCIRLAA